MFSNIATLSKVYFLDIYKTFSDEKEFLTNL